MMWLTRWFVLFRRMIGRRSDDLSEVVPPVWRREIMWIHTTCLLFCHFGWVVRVEDGVYPDVEDFFFLV